MVQKLLLPQGRLTARGPIGLVHHANTQIRQCRSRSLMSRVHAVAQSRAPKTSLSAFSATTSLTLPSEIALSDERTFRETVHNLDPIQFRPQLRKDCILFYTPETYALAKRIAENNPGAITLASIRWKCFADGFPDLFLENAMDIRNRHVAFLASFHTPSVIFEQISVAYALPRLFVSSFTMVLPFFPTGTLERVESEGEVATAFTLARILSNIPVSRGGPASLVIFDIHALQERFYFGDNVLPLFESGIPLLLERLKQLPDHDDITIAYPDEGAWKRFHYQFKEVGYPEVICTKVRDGDRRIVRLKEGEPKGRHIVIVDDLVQSGGTLLECQAMLAVLGATHVSAYVTHGVFPKESWKKFKPDTGGGAAQGFKHFWLTDSCAPTCLDIQNNGGAPFEVLSLAGPIAAALQI